MMWKLHGGGTCSGIVNVHLNLRFIAGLFFLGKALTWDLLNHRGWEGPGRCYLCKDVE